MVPSWLLLTQPPSCLLSLMTACGLNQNNQLWGQPRLEGRAQPLKTALPEGEVGRGGGEVFEALAPVLGCWAWTRSPQNHEWG